MPERVRAWATPRAHRLAQIWKRTIALAVGSDPIGPDAEIGVVLLKGAWGSSGRLRGDGCYDTMKFGTILVNQMKKMVQTIRFGCGVSRVLDGMGVLSRLVDPVHASLCAGVCPQPTIASVLHSVRCGINGTESIGSDPLKSAYQTEDGWHDEV